MKNSTPSRQPPINWPPAANRITRPARMIFFRSISRPIMNSMKIRPSSEMTLNRFLRLDPSHAEWTDEEPGDQIGQYQRLPGKMGGQPEPPGKQDGQRDIANKFVHALSRSAEFPQVQAKDTRLPVTWAMCHRPARCQVRPLVRPAKQERR